MSGNREGCKIENRLNLGHCPNLPDLPPSPKTRDANLIFIKNIGLFKRNKKKGEEEEDGGGGWGSLIYGTTLLFDKISC